MDVIMTGTLASRIEQLREDEQRQVIGFSRTAMMAIITELQSRLEAARKGIGTTDIHVTHHAFDATDLTKPFTPSDKS